MTVAIGAGELAAILMFTLATGIALLGIVALVTSLYPVVTITLAYVVLGERVRGIQRAGVVIALAGVGLLSLAA